MRLMKIIVVLAMLQSAPGSAGEPGRAARLELVAGGGTAGDGASAAQARIVSPFGIGFDAEGTLFFVEMLGHRVRKIGPDGGTVAASRLNAPRPAVKATVRLVAGLILKS